MDLGTSTNWGIIEPIQSNDFEFCIDCGEPITIINDSDWEGFCKDGRTTQKICKKCDNIRNKLVVKYTKKI